MNSSKLMTLTGNLELPDMSVKDSEVTHLRQLLAWMRCEYTLDEDMQRGYLLGAHEAVVHGFATPEKASEIVQRKADEINRVPAYIRHAHKMLTKALRKHETASKIIDTKEPTCKPP